MTLDKLRYFLDKWDLSINIYPESKEFQVGQVMMVTGYLLRRRLGRASPTLIPRWLLECLRWLGRRLDLIEC